MIRIVFESCAKFMVRIVDLFNYFGEIGRKFCDIPIIIIIFWKRNFNI